MIAYVPAIDPGRWVAQLRAQDPIAIQERLRFVIDAEEGLAAGGGQGQSGVHLRIELAGLALDHDALALLRGEAEDVLAVAVAGAVDRRVDGDDLGRRGVGRLLEGDVGQAVRDAEQARVADAEVADEADVVGAGQHVGGDGEAESGAP